MIHLKLAKHVNSSYDTAIGSQGRCGTEHGGRSGHCMEAIHFAPKDFEVFSDPKKGQKFDHGFSATPPQACSHGHLLGPFDAKALG